MVDRTAADVQRPFDETKRLHVATIERLQQPGVRSVYQAQDANQ